MPRLLKRYPVGAVVQDRRGRVSVKTEEGWMPESRLVAWVRKLDRSDPKDIGKPIAKDERVFHIGANKSDNRPENLVVIKINLTKYVLLPTTRCLFLPKGESRTVEEAMHARKLL